MPLPPDDWDSPLDKLDTEARRLRRQRDSLFVSCKKLVQAMVDYQMDVETLPPHKHTMMMREARAAISDTEKNP